MFAQIGFEPMMNSSARNMTRSRLDEATARLRTARILLDDSQELDEKVLVHCKRAAESALKGFLNYHSYHFDDCDGLVELLAHADEIEPGIWPESAGRLASCQYIADEYFDDDPTEVWDDANVIVGQVFAFLADDLPSRAD